jgi:hypothetical protein
MAAPKKYLDELIDPVCGSCSSRAVRSRTQRAIWSQARRKEIDMVDPITAVVAVALITLLSGGKKN